MQILTQPTVHLGGGRPQSRRGDRHGGVVAEHPVGGMGVGEGRHGLCGGGGEGEGGGGSLDLGRGMGAAVIEDEHHHVVHACISCD